VAVLAREPTVAVLPPGHPLARARRLTLRRLAEHPFVLFPREQAPGYHDMLVTAVTSAGAPPRIIQQAAETQTIIGLVAAGVGVSLVPSSVQQLALGGVAYRPVVDAPDTELAALSRRGERTGLVAAFLDAANPSAARA
jgi:DNA-binding transcriptional LysR family regulator